MARTDLDLPRALARIALVGLCTSALAWPAMAQTTVYRCGPDGRSYSRHPCAEGRAVDVADRRTPEQLAEADAAASRTQRALDETAQHRRGASSSSPRMAGALTASPSSASQRADVKRTRGTRSAARTPRSSKSSSPSEPFEAVSPAQRSKAGKR